MGVCPHVKKDFDYWDPETLREPFPLYQEFRDGECPIVKSEMFGGYYVASRYEDVTEVLADFRTYVSGEGISVPDFPSDYSMFPVETDKPLHDEFRRLLTDPLRPKEVAKLEPTARRLVNDLIDRFIERGECEFTKDVSSPLVTKLIGPFTGLDEKYWDGLEGAAYDMLYGEDRETASTAFFDFIKEQFEMRRDGSRDDFLTLLLTAEIRDGEETRHLTEHERLSTIWSVVLAATDTTTGLASTTLWYLAKHPELRQRFVEDPSLIERNLEEFIRMFVGPTLARTVAKPTVLGGVELAPKDKVVFMLAAAGRDERAFERPEEFVFDRRPNKHVAFGLGIHKCVGIHMARMEFKVMMEEVFRRLPDFELAADPDDLVITAGATWQIRTLPLRFSPGVREAAVLV